MNDLILSKVIDDILIVIMPLVIFTGFPSSGKTQRAKELEHYLSTVKECKTHVVSEDQFQVDRNEVFSDSCKEKELRNKLKSEIQRRLKRDEVVILDSCNYIKGYRYELYCLSKSAKTTHCVIHCDTNAETCWSWNCLRENSSSSSYSRSVFDGMVQRFEHPDSQNRWDSPLFTIQVDDKLPLDEMYGCLFLREAPRPNRSTQSVPLSCTNFLYDLDKKTQAAVTSIMEFQRTSVAGDEIVISGAEDRFKFVRPVTAGELARWRRQFISYMKLHPVDDASRIPDLFVRYLNTSIL